LKAPSNSIELVFFSEIGLKVLINLNNTFQIVFTIVVYFIQLKLRFLYLLFYIIFGNFVLIRTEELLPSLIDFISLLFQL